MLVKEYLYNFEFSEKETSSQDKSDYFNISPVKTENFYGLSRDQVVEISNKGRFVIFGEYWQGMFSIYSLANGKHLSYDTDSMSIVTKLILSKDDCDLFVGTSSGRIFLYHIDENLNARLARLITNSVPYPISDLSLNYSLNLLISSSSSNIYLYKTPSFSLIRKVNVSSEELKIKYVLVAYSPLPSIICFYQPGSVLASYSINGIIIKSKKLKQPDISGPTIITDGYFNDFLIYSCSSQGSLVIVSTPYFQHSFTIDLFASSVCTSSVKTINCVKLFEISSDGKMVFFWL